MNNSHIADPIHSRKSSLRRVTPYAQGFSVAAFLPAFRPAAMHPAPTFFAHSYRLAHTRSPISPAAYSLVIGHSKQPDKDLISRTFDITVSSATITNRKILHTPLFEAEFVCVMSSNHPLSKRKYLEVEDFEGQYMISLVEKADSSFYNAFLKENGIRLARFMTIPYPETIVDFAEAGLGIAILPKWFVSAQALTKKIHMCQFTSTKNIRHMKAHYLKAKTIPSYQDEFIKTIVSHTITV